MKSELHGIAKLTLWELLSFYLYLVHLVHSHDWRLWSRPWLLGESSAFHRTVFPTGLVNHWPYRRRSAWDSTNRFGFHLLAVVISIILLFVRLEQLQFLLLWPTRMLLNMIRTIPSLLSASCCYCWVKSSCWCNALTFYSVGYLFLGNFRSCKNRCPKSTSFPWC